MSRVGRRVNGFVDELLPSVVREAVAEASERGWAIDESSDYCPRCGATAAPSAVTGRGCPYCVNVSLPWQRLTRLGMYQSPWAEWVKQLKFGGHWPWADWMGRRLAEAVGPSLTPGHVVVCPVPLHWSRRMTRGFNQSRLISQALAEQRGWPCAALLRRARYAVPQSRLAPSRRVSNVRRCFTIRNVDLSGYEVILVDDVKTTGSTVGQCARLLHRVGAVSVHVAVVAVADPLGMNFATT